VAGACALHDARHVAARDRRAVGRRAAAGGGRDAARSGKRRSLRIPSRKRPVTPENDEATHMRGIRESRRPDSNRAPFITSDAEPRNVTALERRQGHRSACYQRMMRIPLGGEAKRAARHIGQAAPRLASDALIRPEAAGCALRAWWHAARFAGGRADPVLERPRRARPPSVSRRSRRCRARSCPLPTARTPIAWRARRRRRRGGTRGPRPSAAPSSRRPLGRSRHGRRGAGR